MSKKFTTWITIDENGNAKVGIGKYVIFSCTKNGSIPDMVKMCQERAEIIFEIQECENLLVGINDDEMVSLEEVKADLAKFSGHKRESLPKIVCQRCGRQWGWLTRDVARLGKPVQMASSECMRMDGTYPQYGAVRDVCTWCKEITPLSIVYGEGEIREWQPIETAPKDEYKSILGYAEGTMATVVWIPVGNDGRWTLRETGAFAENGEWNPTHWMPLPDPPKAALESLEEFNRRRTRERWLLGYVSGAPMGRKKK